MIDKKKLIEWVTEHAETHTVPLVAAIYAGLAQRLERGDFDMEEGN